MSDLKSVAQLAKEHMRSRKTYKTNKAKNSLNRMNVKCIMCEREMTTTKDENPPFYCYKCHDEAEGVFGLG